MMPPQNADLCSEQYATSGQPFRAPAALTPNQKKKRRQKLAKLSKVQKVLFRASKLCKKAGFKVARANAVLQAKAAPSSMQSDTTLAGSEASTSVFVPVAGYTKTSAAREPSTHMFGQSAIGAANTSLHHEGASSGSVKPEQDLAISVEDSAQVSSTNNSSASYQHAFQSTLQQPSDTTASAVSWPAASVVQTDDSHTVQATESKRPLSSQQPGSVCRHDLSGAAMMMRAAMLTEISATLATPPETDAHAQQPPPKRQKKVFVHGNYSAYYGYRLGTELAEDPRLQVLDRRWFHNKRCLDIGCNEGVITLAVVQRFAPLSMLGVDIDEGLVKAACRALSKQRTEASQLHQRLLRHASAELGDRPAAQRKAAAAAVRAFGNVYFTCEDFAISQHASQSLDNIMCLSVTKWVHLNQGDEGLKRLFAKVAHALAPGGWFVLEPQPWRSYKQARRKQDMSAAPFARADMLHLRPEDFPDYLQQELGFVLVRELHVATSSVGFNRPMYLFQKPT